MEITLFHNLRDGSCGEYGEYHSFVYDGPVFTRPVALEVGEIVVRDTRYYADLIPADGPRSESRWELSIPPVQ